MRNLIFLLIFLCGNIFAVPAGYFWQVPVGATIPSWNPLNIPIETLITTTGTGVGFMVEASATITSAITAGATYTNSGNTWTVPSDISLGSLWVPLVGAFSSPGGSQTFTKASGTGPATFATPSIPFNETLYSTTASTNPLPLWFQIAGVGPGGGGAGSGSGSPGSGGSPAGPTFVCIIAGCVELGFGVGAIGSAAGTEQGGGGGLETALGPMSGITIISQIGGQGQGSTVTATTSVIANGGNGGESCYAGAGAGGAGGTTGVGAVTNSGSGGGGGGGTGLATQNGTGAGGGAGACASFKASQASVGGTIYWTFESGGSQGSAGTNGATGGPGAASKWIFDQFFQ